MCGGHADIRGQRMTGPQRRPASERAFRELGPVMRWPGESPVWAAFRQTLHSAMPKLLSNGHKTPKEEMRELLDQVKPKALRERLLKVWAKW